MGWLSQLSAEKEACPLASTEWVGRASESVRGSAQPSQMQMAGQVALTRSYYIRRAGMPR